MKIAIYAALGVAIAIVIIIGAYSWFNPDADIIVEQVPSITLP